MWIRWSRTPFGSAGVQGDPIRLTFSFAPDGTPLPTLEKEKPTPSNLHSVFNAAFPDGEVTWKSKLRAALRQWTQVAGIVCTEVSDDGAAFPNSFGRNTAPIRGEIRIAGHPIDGTTNQNNVLAITTTPDGGDIVVDTDDVDFFADSTLDYLYFRNAIGHELGHALGFDHSDPLDLTKLMESRITTNFDGPQDDDIRAAQRYYGDIAENNDTAATAVNLRGGGLGMHLENLSTDSVSDEDWFVFYAVPSRLLTVAVVPVGSSYPVAPEDTLPPLPIVDTLRINKLCIDIRAADGTLLARGNTQALGNAEFVYDVPMDHAGQFVYISVYNATSGSTASDDVQRYNLYIDETRIALATVTGTVSLQSIVNSIVPMIFVFHPQPNGEAFARFATLNTAGNFMIPNVPAGDYYVAVKGDRWLQKTVGITVTFSGPNTLNVDLRGGDSNNDNIVDIADLSALIVRYNQVSGAPNSIYSLAVDFDNDGANGFSDLLILISNYNVAGDP